MEIEIRTYKFKLGAPPEIHRGELPISVSASREPLPRIETVSRAFPLSGGQPAIIKGNLISPAKAKKIPISAADKTNKTTSKKIKIEKIDTIKTTAVAAALPRSPRAIRIACRPPESTPTFTSPFLEHAMISRQALERKHIPYPVMTEYMIALAERHKTSYTNISFIGVFDPVPMHLAKNIALDSSRGLMKFSVKKIPSETSGRRIVRVVYGRMRTTGEIVSALLPVT